MRHTYTREMIENAKTVAEAWEGRFATHEYELVMEKDIVEKLQLILKMVIVLKQLVQKYMN